MMFDSQLLFWHTGTVYAFTQGEFVSMVTASTSASTAINIVNPADLGVGSGEAIPKIAIMVGTGITSASTSMTLNFQFQGSTNSTNWTTYAETGTISVSNSTTSTASNYAFNPGNKIFPIDLPEKPVQASLPQYYRLNMVIAGTNGTDTISAGTLLAGVVLSRDDNITGLYPSGFTVI